MIAAIVRCYKLNWMLDKVLKNLSDVDLVLVAVCNFTNDNCEELTSGLVRNLQLENVACIFYKQMEQKDLFNKCVKKLSDLGATHIFINDADEILLPNDRKRIIAKMDEHILDSMHCTVIDYADMGCKEQYEVRTHKPVVCIKPTAVFDGNRSVGSGGLMEEIELHHFGHALDKDDWDWKMNNLWYEPESIKQIIESKKVRANPPQELLNRMGA